MKTWAGGGSYGWPAPPGRDRQNWGAAGTRHRWKTNRFNVSHIAPEARSAQSRTIGLRPHLQPRLEHYRYAVQVL
jgi:hypothetical protein